MVFARVVLPLTALCVTGCVVDEERSVPSDAGSDAPVSGERPDLDEQRDAARVDIDAASPDAQREARAWTPSRLDASMLDAAQLESATPGAADASCVRAETPKLATAVVEHACLHGSDGPFRVVDGASSSDTAPDVSRAHTLFTVLGAPGAILHVRYVPTTPGDHVLFVARGELVAARQGASSLVAERGLVDCEVLPLRYVVQLVDRDHVELTLRADGDHVALLIESLAGWGAAWTAACGRHASTTDAGTCRSQGPCSSDSECCSYCHDYDHCH
jgi:hypothetical protein